MDAKSLKVEHAGQKGGNLFALNLKVIPGFTCMKGHAMNSNFMEKEKMQTAT